MSSALDGDGKGEKLIVAYATNLSDILPDVGNFGPKENFAQGLTGAFLSYADCLAESKEQLIQPQGCP